MAAGSLIRHFGVNLLEIIAGRLATSWADFPRREFVGRGGDLDGLPLMKRVGAIATFLSEILPKHLPTAWTIMRGALPEPLDVKGKIFNDGHWMLPLASFWGDYGISDLPTTIAALEELTQRGTCEFAIRDVIRAYPTAMEDVVERWVSHPSFHVRRLAGEGTRPYLPWRGKLNVPEVHARRYLESIAPLKDDPSAYVRRSVGNHVRDWRRMDPSIADGWIERNAPPPDVTKLASPRR